MSSGILSVVVSSITSGICNEIINKIMVMMAVIESINMTVAAMGMANSNSIQCLDQ